MNRHLLGLANGERLYLMGADRLGRDLFARIVYGSRVSLTIGLIGVALSLVLGIVIRRRLGVLRRRNRFGDTADHRDHSDLFPRYRLWLALSAAMPAYWSNLRVYFCMTVILALVGWTGLARVVRGKILALREEDYVVAAKVAGVREFTIILRHLIPGFLSHLIVTATLAIPGMILAEDVAEFLAAGASATPRSVGGYCCKTPRVSARLRCIPGCCSRSRLWWSRCWMFNFFGDGLRDAADPYSH